MKLARLSFDDSVTIFAGRETGGGEARQDHRDSAFAAADGWVLEWLPDSEQFRVWREGMPEPTTLGGYGYSFERMPDAPAFVGDPFGGTAAQADAGVNVKAIARRRR